jgi:hypothetical protein
MRNMLKACLVAALVAATPNAIHAVELKVFGTNVPSVDFHGFASQGAIINSGHNDYLGGDSHNGSFDFREYGVNGSMVYGKWRLGAQIFGEKLGPYGNDDPQLDWGMLDYQPAQWFGVRGGRVKMPRGLYNEALDLDSTRPFVLLPQSVYDARLRDFQASVDGGMIYGNIDLNKLGSLDYKVFGGRKDIPLNSGASDYFNVDAPFLNNEISMDYAIGGTLFWNTPVLGLRSGFSYSRFENFTTVRYVPSRARNVAKVADHYDRYLGSVEYMVGDFVFAVEGGADVTVYDIQFVNNSPYGHLYPSCYYYYASAAWRANKWLELGTYYSTYHFDQFGKGTPLKFPTLDQNDFALSARFDLTDYLLFKLEGHYLDGAGEVFDLPGNKQPVPKRDTSWFMFAAKVTFSF